MSSLALSIRPDNFRAPPGVMIESDVFGVCERMKELDKNLFLYALDPPVEFAGKTYRFSVTEMCVDGVERLVQRFEELDARIDKKLAYMLHVPFEKRLAEAEQQEAKAEQQRKDDELTKLYEGVGRPMLTDLEKCGFIQRSVSYPKRGVKPR